MLILLAVVGEGGLMKIQWKGNRDLLLLSTLADIKDSVEVEGDESKQDIKFNVTVPLGQEINIICV